MTSRQVPDLDSVDQIAEMVRAFYARVALDDLLGPVFNEVAQVDWDEHLPKLTAFWARALLDVQGYSGNPYRQHASVHGRSPLTPAHFDRWLRLFRSTVGARWQGPRADQAVELATNVARVHRGQLLGERIPLVARPGGAPVLDG